MRLEEAIGCGPVLARVLAGRGMIDPTDAESFLHPTLDTLSSPLAFAGAEAAIERLLAAVESGERILVFGDFDVDGVTGTSLAYLGLRAVGANVDWLLPRRMDHGYGLSERVLPEVLARKPGLLLTVDCGIRSVQEVASLRESGVDVVVTDHHEAGPELPPAVAVVDPKQPGCPYPDKNLAAVGVVYQLLRGLNSRTGHFTDPTADLDLVALGTVADVVPLVGENRALVREGMRVLNRRAKVGVHTLLQESGIEGQVEPWHIAFLLGPRINAAGRLGDASDAVRLFTAEDTTTAADLARSLGEANRARQDISRTTVEDALAAIDRGTAGDQPDGIVLASNSWHPGVLGIAASKVVERHYRPTVLFSFDGSDTGRGSARSIAGVDVHAALEECADLLVQFGGHSMAAGMTIDRAHLSDFRTRFAGAIGSQLTEKNSRPLLRIDTDLEEASVTLDLAEELDRMGPFGLGNPRPVFLMRNVDPVDRRVVGKGHLKLRLSDGAEGGLECIGFNLGEEVSARPFPPGRVDLVGTVNVNEWRGRRTPQLRVDDFREATP
ncbi:MAG: single-stranded-DNA-specific exonuclease RecJ [Gemmatimonadota bacterium]|nr:single-stranded-DNA-specific exonuclease RecJ [Gemmatimonadota bacterium]MDP6528845.1 single-stranded-DNA-specific exonuclease RecJ [Gemmatimonadota bacterium]MDP6802399.1 single-stranded-DNA-specific exonuclease RecJ [Gemmatimonadota bacterium]